MFGRNVDVVYKGKEMQVFVLCTPSTPMSTLEKWALNKLARLEMDHPSFSLEDIQSQLNMRNL